MVEKSTMHDLDLLYSLQNRLLIAKLPYEFPGVTIDAIRRSQHRVDGTFFEIIHPALGLIDMMLGCVKAKEKEEGISSLLMATVIKMTLLRLAKPVPTGQHFDKTRLWETNLLSLPEIIKRLHDEAGEILSEFGFTLTLFYGRLNLEYNTFSYLDYGSNHPIYYHSAQKQSSFLQNSYPPLGTIQQPEFRPTRLDIEPGDAFILYSENLKKDFSNEDPYFSHFHLIPLIEQHAHLNASGIISHIIPAMDELKPKNEENVISLVIVIKTNDEKQITSFKHATAKFASDLSQLQAVRTFVQRACHQTPGDSDKLSLQMQLLINEVFCNIVKHSYHSHSKGEIIIESRLADNGIYFTVSDKGETFNPAETKYPNLAGDQEDGFGLFIIQQIADHLSYVPKTAANEWNHLHIFKRYFSEEDQMDFSHHIQDQVLIITPKGDNLDAKNAPSFKEQVLNLIRTSGKSQLVFDLKQLQFIDSSGLGTFLSIQRMLNAQGGVLKLANLNKPIRTMFEIVSMHRIFDIFNSTEEAVSSF